jgi:hypothetical protein
MMRPNLQVNAACYLFASVLVMCLAGCGSQDDVRVQLQAYATPKTDPRRVEIRAQVTGPQAGLRYKWFSIAGECEPQESDWPATSFKFADAATRDRVSVELWRNDKRVAQNQIDVKLDQERARLAMDHLPKVDIQITQIPPYEPEGGPNTRGDIAGKVTGELVPELKVVLYARADAWYMQPTPYALHTIRPDNTFTSWTHTGSSYAALIVRPGFDPFLRLDVLPQVGGYVLARTIVDGVRNTSATR